jgi:hypothetical protein
MRTGARLCLSVVDEPGMGEAVGDVAPSGGLGPTGAGRMGLNRLCMDSESDCATDDQVVQDAILFSITLEELRHKTGKVERFEGAPRCQSACGSDQGSSAADTRDWAERPRALPCARQCPLAQGT